MQKTALILIVLSYFLIFAPQTFAARNLSITANKSALFGNEELIVTASTSGFTNNETIYIKGAFHQEGGSNYFGYTKSSDNWIKNGEATTSQRQIKIGEWDGTLTLKADFTDSGYLGEGSYKLKVGFYYVTSGGNVSSINWSSNNVDIAISEPDPTPVPTATSVPTAAPTMKLSPVVTSKPTIVTKPVLSKVPTVKTNKKVLGESDRAAQAIKVSSTAKPELPVRDFTKREPSDSRMGAIFFILGALLLISCAILVYLKIRKKNQEA